MTAVASDLLDAATALGDRLASELAYLHAHPELSWEEHHTTERVAAWLTRLGLEPREFDGMTGLTADVVLGDGPTVALRADLDALPLDDRGAGPVRSTVRGVSHACGHDVHTVSLLGAAALLQARVGHGGGTVRLVFQPAEEAIPGGAPRVLATGVLDDAVAIAALHCDPTLALGRFAARDGAITAAADQLTFTLRGSGGHTARPHLTDDLVTMIADLAMSFPGLVQERLAEHGDVSIVFGHVEAGDAPNVVPSLAVLEGTFRTRDRAAWDHAEAAVADAAAQRLGAAEWSLDHRRGNPPVVNDPVVTDTARRALSGLVGPDAVVEAPQSLGSEDFSWYLDSMPGTYVRLGVAPTAESAPDLHAAEFSAAPGAEVHGAAALAAIALELLADAAG